MRRRQLGAADVEARLAKKFAAPEYAFMTQVGNATGSGTNRHADAIAMSLWPSRGIELHGFEIKVDRGDFLREVKNPAKAEELQRFCHYWWIVTGPDVVMPGDLFPSTWGHMATEGAGLVVKIKAPRLTALPLTVEVTASLFRSFAETVPQLKKEYVHVDTLEKVIDERVAEEVAAKTNRDHLLAQYNELRKRVDDFEQASGVKISERWRGAAEVGRAVELILRHRDNDAFRSRAIAARDDLIRIANDLLTVITATGPMQMEKSA